MPGVPRPRSPRRAALLIALLAFSAVAGGCEARPSVVKVGEPAPAITGTTLDGASFDLATLRGRPVVVNFWASWCGPCREEFPMFKAKLEEHAATGLVIVGVMYKDDADAARGFAHEFGIPWATVTDPSGAVATSYRVVAPPQTYFVDGSGIVRSIQIGQVREADFERQLAQITGKS